jgi:hypothetical protein
MATAATHWRGQVQVGVMGARWVEAVMANSKIV